MAGSRRAQIDQWRPEESSIRDRDRERPLERSDSRERSPAARRGRDDHDRNTKRSQPGFGRLPSSKHSRARSRERSRSRSRTRRRSRSRGRHSPSPRGSRDDLYRPSRGRTPSVERVSHTHRHRRHNSPPSTKRRRSLTPSPPRDNSKRTKRRRSRSVERSPSRSRQPDSSRRVTDRAYSSRPPRTDRAVTRRPSPDSYIPSSTRRRSRSADSHYRPPPKHRKRSITPDKKPTSRREESPRRYSPRRHYNRRHTPSVEGKDRSYKEASEKDLNRSRGLSSRPSRAFNRSRSPRYRQSPSRPARRSSPRPLRREKEPSHEPRSSRLSPRRRPSRSPPALESRASARTDNKEREHTKPGPGNKSFSRRNSPRPISSDTSDTQKSADGDVKMRDPYPTQGRPPRPPADTRSNFSHSPPYMTPTQISPQSQSPYSNARGGWGGQPHYGSHQG